METLLKPCSNCHKPMNGGVYRASHICPHCLFEHEGGKSKSRRKPAVVAQPQADNAEVEVGEPSLSEETVEAASLENSQEPPTEAVEQKAEQELEQEKAAAVEVKVESVEAKPTAPAAVFLTSKPADEQSVIEALGEISTECALSISLTPDLFENGKFIGVKSDKVKAALVQGKKHALMQLKQKAQDIEANLVSDVAIKNSVKAGEGKKANIVVKATGSAAIAEIAEESCEV